MAKQKQGNKPQKIVVLLVGEAKRQGIKPEDVSQESLEAMAAKATETVFVRQWGRHVAYRSGLSSRQYARLVSGVRAEMGATPLEEHQPIPVPATTADVPDTPAPPQGPRPGKESSGKAKGGKNKGGGKAAGQAERSAKIAAAQARAQEESSPAPEGGEKGEATSFEEDASEETHTLQGELNEIMEAEGIETVSDLAEILNVSKSTLYGSLKAGTPSEKLKAAMEEYREGVAA